MRNVSRRGLSLLLALVMLCGLLPGEAWAAAGDPEGSAAWEERREEDPAQTGPEDPEGDPAAEGTPEEGGDPSPEDPSAPEPEVPEQGKAPDPEEAEPGDPEEEAEPEAALLAAANEYNGFTYTLNKEGNACTITGYTGSETELVIPDEINEIPVTEIGNRAFDYEDALTRVVLPETLESIGEYAFYDCDGLTEIRIPSKVTRIGRNAFNDCGRLVRVDLVCGAPAIGYSAFGSCPSLAAVCFYDEPPVQLDNANSSSLFSPSFSTSRTSSFFCVCFPQDSELSEQTGSDWNGYRTDVFLPLSGQEETGSASGITLRFDPVTGVITGYTGEPEDLVIPGELNGTRVTGIAPGAFFQCASLTSLTLPEGLTYLGTGAFCKCTSLESVSLPGSLETVGASAFQGCSSLSQVTMGSGMESLSTCMFAKCSALTEITLPEGLSEIPDCCFYDCRLAFANAPLSIPQGVTRIGEYAFQYNSTLTGVDLPASVTSIGNCAFSGCGKLTGVTLREGLKTIGSQAFHSCQNLSKIKLPDGVTGIGDSAFESCNALTEIDVPGSVKVIGKKAFYSTGLTAVTLNEGLQEIQEEAFKNNSKLSRIEIPSTVTRLGQYAFSSCRLLEAAFFYGDAPACVSSSGSGAGCFFSNCKSTFKIYYNVSRSGWTEPLWEGYPSEPFSPSSGDGVVSCTVQGCTLLFNLGSSMIVGYTGSPTDLTIPAEIQGARVTGISAEVFSSCNTLTSVILPEGLEFIGTRSFYNCANLTSATLPSTLKRIGSNAFQNCAKLENLPGMGSQEALGTLGENAFSGCTALKAVTLPGSLEEIPASCFSGCTSLASVTFSQGLRRIGANAFEKCGLTAADLPEGLESIKLNAFLECAALESVNLPKSLTEIGSYAFKSCTALAEIAIPDSTQTLGTGVFSICSSLETAVLSDGITGIPSQFFSSCGKLREIEIPDTVTEIGDSAFSSCKALTHVTLPERLITIGGSAFSYCTGLTRIDIPASVTSIGSSAFYNCSHLASAFFYGEPPALETTPSRFRYCAGSFTIHYIEKEGTAWTKPLWNDYKAEPFTPVSQNASEFALDNGAVLFDRDTGLITGYTGTPGKAVIPSRIENVPVRGITAGAFENCTSLTSIELPEGLVSIGAHAFSGCSALTGVTLPQSLERIGTAAFQNCVQLKEITLPAGVAEIPDYTFYGCTALGSAVLPEELSTIGVYAFSNCASMTELTIPDSVSSLGQNAFSSCTALKTITLPAGISEISPYCFEKCNALEGIEIPEKVSTIEKYAFSGCIGLKDVVFHEGLRTIRDLAFASCKSLLRVDFPESLEFLDGMIFDSNSALRDAYFYGEPPKTGQYYVFSYTPGVKVHYIQREGTAWPEDRWQSCYPTEPFIPAPKNSVDIQVTGGTLLLDKDTGLISSYSGDLSAIVIPARAWDGTPVLGIAGTAFSGCASLTSVTLEEGLKTVGGSAFRNCSALKTVSLPSTLEEIGGSAFRDCAKLETVDLHASKIRRIPAYCFSGCSTLSSVKLPEKLGALGEYAFSSCENLLSISLPEGIPEIPASCFSSCNKLKEIHIPKTVTKILSSAFSNCSHLTHVTLEEGLVSIGGSSFYRCSFSRVDFPSTVTEIGSDAFNACRSLTAAYFNGNAPSTFSAASSNSGSFRDCAGSFKIYYLAGKDGWTPVSWKGYATEIFAPASGNTAEYPVDGGTLRFDRDSGLIIGYTESPRVIDLPVEIENIPVTGIAAEAFANCASLTSVTLPEGLQTIGPNAFLNCTALSEVTLPKGLQTLGGSAFFGCTALTEITLPDSLEETGMAVFRGCTNLRQVRLSDHLRVLNQEAFYGCTSLTEITLPESLETIEDSAFYGCTGLTGISLPASVSSIGNSAFRECTKLKNVTLPKGLTELGANAFYQCEALSGIVIPDSVTALNGYTFYECSSLETVILPDNFEAIGNSTFSSCVNLTYIVLPDSVTSIGEGAFSGCSALKEIVIPPKVKDINKKGFYSCKLLTSVTLPEGLISIGEDAFAGCASLSWIRIPSTVTTIRDRAFRGCTALRAAYFTGNAPGTLTAGGSTSSSSFYSCSKDFKIYYINGKSNWETPKWKNYPTVCMFLRNGSYYEAVTTPMTWEDAQAYAAKQGGRLASAPNEDLANHLEALARTAGAGSLWLGGRKDSGGAWTWLSGADWDYQRFPEGSQQDGPYLCLQLPDGGGTGSWASGTAEETRGFLLEVSMEPSAAERPSGNQELTYPVEGGALRFDPKTGTITGYTGNPVQITVPRAIRGFPVTAVNAAAFNDCASLASISVEAGHSAFSAADGILYSADQSTLLLCPKARTGEVTLPETCTSIGKYAFACCAQISSVTLPQGLTEIQEGAFFQCGGLTTLTVPESMTSIGGSAFRYCGALNSVYFPGDAPALGGNAFDGCAPELTLWFIQGRYGWTAPQWNGLQTQVFQPQPDDGIRYYAIDGGSLRFSTETGEILGCSGSPSTAALPREIAGVPVTGIGAGAFRDQKNLAAVYLPVSLERIGEDAFTGCASGLTLYGPRGSVGAAYGEAHNIPFTVCAIASVSPSTASTVGGARTQEIAVTMTGPVTLPLIWALLGPDGKEIPLAKPTVKLNSSGQAVHTLALDLTELASGSYTLRLSRSEYGVDTAVTYDVDRTPPAQPKSLRVSPGALSNILTWDRGPEADIQSVRIYRAADPQGEPVQLAELKESGVTSYTDKSLADETTEYFYWISFVDRFGQESALAGPVSSKAQADTEAPTTITGMDPVNGTTLTGAVTFQVSAEDNVQLASIAMVISRENLTGEEAWADPEKAEVLDTVETGKTARFTLDSTKYEKELYVRFLLTDSSGNRGWSDAVYHYPIDNDPPEQVANLRAQTSATIITLSWDDVSAKDLDCFLVEELQADGTWKEIGQVRDILGMNITGLTPGSAHTYRVAARDVNGNVGAYSEPVTASATADTTPPVIQKHLPAPSRYKDQIQLIFTVWDNHGIQTLTVETSPDGQTWSEAGIVEITDPASQTTEVRYALETGSFPEGSLYVRGIAVDLSGNKSDTSSKAPSIQYVVDRTAPAAPAGLKASLAYQSIHLAWEQGPERDLDGYRVYRQTGDGEPQLLKSGLEMITYTDKDVTIGQTYTYYLTCADTAGNVSEACAPVTVTMAAVADTEPPQVVSVSPSDGYTLGLETPLKVQVFDDQLVQSLSFRLSSDGSSWTDWEAVETGEAESVITLPKTARDTAGGRLYLEVFCTDAAGHASETVSRTYTVDRTLPAAPVLTKAEAGARCVELAWTCESEEHLAGFYIFRQAADGSEIGWTQVGQAAPAGQSPYAYTFTDKSVQIKRYIYRVSAVTAIGNRADSKITDPILPRDDDIMPPTVRITGNTVGTAGMEMSFSAARSTDNVGIASYQWDFGDGGTSALKEPRHTYQAAGSYTVSLTVSDAAGNEAHGLVRVRVIEPGQAAVLNVTVIDENGRQIPDAGVYFNLGDAQEQNTVYTNASGTVQILAEEGTYRVGAYKSGYLPAQRTVELLKGAPKNQTLSLVNGDIVTGELTVERMTLQEIEAAGIDPALPANQEVFQYEVVLTYGSEKAPIHTLINSAGDILVDPKPITIHNEKRQERTLYPFVLEGSKEPVGGGGSMVGPEVPLIAVLDLPGETRWMKDHFDVRLYIFNQAQTSFVLDNCAAVLEVPEGLTLVDSKRTESVPQVTLGSIAGQSSAAAEWILQGDRPGDYTLSARFQGTLRDFNEEITARFETSEAFHVRQGDNLFLDVMLDSAIGPYGDGAVRVGLRNEDPEPYNLPSISLEKARLVSTFKTKGLVPVNTDLRILNPGEEIWFDYVISREDWEILTKRENEEFYLLNQIGKALEGTALQISFLETAPGTVAADRLEVYEILEDGSLAEISYIDARTTGRVPNLKLITCRLNEQREYKPCSMDLIVADSLKMRQGGEPDTVTTGVDGSWILKGYDLPADAAGTEHTLGIYPSRGRPAELPLVLPDTGGKTGTLRISAGILGDGGAVTAVPGAQVTLEGESTLTQTTDASGQAVFKDIPQGLQTVRIQAEGCLPLAQAVRVNQNTVQTFLLTRDSDPGASRVTAVSGPLLDSAEGNYAVIPYGVANGVAEFTPEKRIAQGETFQGFRYRITAKDGSVREEERFAGASILLDIAKLQPGDTLSFAVDTLAGGAVKTSAFTPVRIQVVEMPETLKAYASGMMNIAKAPDNRITRAVDLTEHPGIAFTPLERFAPLQYLQGFTGEELDPPFSDMTGAANQFTVQPRADARLYPVSISYETGGSFTLTFLFGAKPQPQEETGEEGKTEERPRIFQADAQSFFDLTEAHDQRAGAEGTILLELIYTYDPLEDRWTRQLQGEESVKSALATLYPESSWRVVSQAETEERAAWSLSDPNPEGAIDENLFSGEGLSALGLNGGLRVDLGGKPGAHSSLTGYLESGFQAAYDSKNGTWSLQLEAEIGRERTFLAWKSSGAIVKKAWEITPGGGSLEAAEAELLSLLAGEPETALNITGNTGATWTDTGEVIAQGIYGESAPQTAALPDGRTLMVFIGAGGSGTDASNPTELKYSIYDNGHWSTPLSVSGNGTMDLSPALTATESGAAAVWIDLSEKLSGAESMTVSQIQQQVCSKMTVCMSVFDGKAWSDPITLASPNCLAGRTAIASGGGRTAAVWIQNSKNTEQADAAHPDTAAYAVAEDGKVVESGTVLTASGAAGTPALAFSGGVFTLACGTGGGELASLRLENGQWFRGDALSHTGEADAAAAPDSHGTLYCIAGDRLLARRGGGVTELAASGLLAGGSGLRALRLDGQTFLIWVQSDDSGSRICLCAASEDGAASQPVILAESRDSQFLSPSVIRDGSGYAAVYLSRTYGEDQKGQYTASCELRQTPLPMGQEVRLDSAETRPLYPGAAVTTLYQCSNRGLVSAESVTLTVSRDPHGADPINTFENQKLSGSLDWTVPADYSGEPLYLTVPCGGGSSDSAVLGSAFVDLAVSGARLLGAQAGAVKVTLENNGLAGTGEITLSVQDPATGEALHQETVSGLDGGARSDYVLPAADLQGLKTVRITAQAANGDVKTENNRRNVYLSAPMAQPVVPDPDPQPGTGLVFGDPVFTCDGGNIHFTQTVTNKTGQAAGAVIFLSLYDANGRLLRTVQRSVQLAQDREETLRVETVLSAAEKAAASGARTASVILADQKTFAPLQGKRTLQLGS